MKLGRMTLGLLCGALALGAAGSEAQAQRRQSTVDARYVKQQLRWALDQITRVERKVESHCGRRRGLHRELRQLRQYLQNVVTHVRAGRRYAPAAPVAEPVPVPSDPVPQPAAPVITAMHPRAFGGLLARVRAQSFSRGRLAVVSTAASHNHFTSHQVLRVLQQFSFSRAKLDALRVLAPRILDPQNSYVIYGAFSFSSAKAEARVILQRALPRSP